jgi:RecA-family ATPase
MPDGSHGVSGSVLILSAEDDAEDTILPRLEAAGADLTRVEILDSVEGLHGDRPPEIPADLALIEEKLTQIDARLLIIDPLVAFLVGADANKDQEVRRALYKLSRIAARRRCSPIAMRHLNKHSGGKALYRGNMSIGVIGHARGGLLVAQDPEDEALRVMAVTKSNLASPPPSLYFRLDPVGQVCRIAWLGQAHYKADELVQPPPTEEEKEQRDEALSKMELAMQILKLLIEEAGGQVERKTALKECEDAGVSRRTTERAVRKMGLALAHLKDGSTRAYYWTLPNGEVATSPEPIPP